MVENEKFQSAPGQMNQTSDLIVVGSGGTGLTVDDRLRVLNETDEPIPGLNAGATGAQGGMVIWGYGLHICRVVTSGRLVAESAVSG